MNINPGHFAIWGQLSEIALDTIFSDLQAEQVTSLWSTWEQTQTLPFKRMPFQSMQIRQNSCYKCILLDYKDPGAV